MPIACKIFYKRLKKAETVNKILCNYLFILLSKTVIHGVNSFSAIKMKCMIMYDEYLLLKK